MSRPIVPAPIPNAPSGRSALACFLAILSLLLLPSCGCTSCDEPLSGGTGTPLVQAPHFLLEDANDSSPTHLTHVSPRAYLGGVSAWYFGHST